MAMRPSKVVIANGETAIYRLQATLRMAEVAFAGFRFGNLNTPDDLHAAGIDPEHHA